MCNASDLRRVPTPPGEFPAPSGAEDHERETLDLFLATLARVLLDVGEIVCPRLDALGAAVDTLRAFDHPAQPIAVQHIARAEVARLRGVRLRHAVDVVRHELAERGLVPHIPDSDDGDHDDASFTPDASRRAGR